MSRGSSVHAHNEEDMLSLVKEQLLRQQLLMEEEQLLFKHEAKNIYNIECSPKILSVIKLKLCCCRSAAVGCRSGSGSDVPFSVDPDPDSDPSLSMRGKRGTEPRQKEHIQILSVIAVDWHRFDL